ncbi:hypothetical protein FRB94_014741 [Tulasnella sp. JGI-2019a]|nr:hypothetical protein FRB94_014741 [Tulasnella sp. JGI-2019a]
MHMGMPMPIGKQAKKKAIPRNLEQMKCLKADTPVISTSMDYPDGENKAAAGPSCN